MKRAIGVLIGLLLVAGAALFVAKAWRRPLPAPDVRVVFLGYSNDVAVGLLGRFVVSNASPGPVVRHVGYRVQVEMPGPRGWSNLVDAWFPGSANLPAGRAETVAVPVAGGSNAWRLDVKVSREERLVSFLAGEAVREANRLGLRTPYGRCRSEYRVRSDWVAADEVAAAHSATPVADSSR